MLTSAGLLLHSTFWYDTVEHHHLSEETDLFPAIERIAIKPGLMEQNAEQHHAFRPRVKRLRSYRRDTNLEGNNETTLREILEVLSANF